MRQQLAVISPQFGDLSPIDGSRRNVQRALGKADRRLLTDAIQEFAAHVDRLAAIMQPSMELAKRYAAAVAEDLA